MNKKMRKKSDFLISAVFTLFIILPLFLIIIRLVAYEKENRNQTNIAKVLSEYQTSIPEASSESVFEVTQDMYVDINGLRVENKDAVGYVKVPGTEIAYPVVQTKDSTTYTKTDFYGKKSIYGCIFMDPASYMNGTNLVLYGHNMKSGQMFGSLKSYLDEAFKEEHPYIWFTTDQDIRIYKICAVFKASAKEEELIKNLIPYEKTELENLDTFIKEHGTMEIDSLKSGKQYITLGTCEYTQKNGRLFVMGEQVETIRLQQKQ